MAKPTFVYLSATTTGGNALGRGEIVELGAVRYVGNTLKDTFEIVNYIEDLDNYRVDELSVPKIVIQDHGQPIENWFVELERFIGKDTVVMYDTYEVLNHLLSYGFSFKHVVDLKYVLLAQNNKWYDDFVALTEKYVKKPSGKRGGSIHRRLIKPVMMRHITHRLRLTSHLPSYMNDIFVAEEHEGYTGINGGHLIFSDGTRLKVKDKMDVYEETINQIIRDEEAHYGEKGYEEVLARLQDTMTDVIFDVTPISRFYRMKHGDDFLLVTPTSVWSEKNLELEEIYSVIEHGNDNAVSRIRQAFLTDSTVAEFFTTIIRQSDLDYAIEPFDYIRKIFAGILSELVDYTRDINSLHDRQKSVILDDFDTIPIQGKVYEARVSVADNYLIVEWYDHINNQPIIEYSGDFDSLKRTSQRAYEFKYAEHIYQEMVTQHGISVLEDDINVLVEKVENYLDDLVDKLPSEEVVITDYSDKEERFIAQKYGEFARFNYTPPQKDGTGHFIKIHESSDILTIYFKGYLSLVELGQDENTTEIRDKYELLRRNERLYNILGEHDKIMKKIFDYGYDDFETDNDTPKVDMSSLNKGKESEYDDFEHDTATSLISGDLSQVEVGNMSNRLRSDVNIKEKFKYNDLISYLADRMELGEDTIEMVQSSEAHEDVLRVLRGHINDNMIEGKLGDNGTVECNDATFEVDYPAFSIEDNVGILSFIERTDDHVVQYHLK